MTTQKTEALLKPDMRAVLARTHLDQNLHGFLLPILEAISNAMDSIGARFQQDTEKASQEGLVQIRIRNLNQPSGMQITVVDNGEGLTDPNYNYFRTPFSGHKLDRRGRGFGRFIAFKVFSQVLYGSRHRFFGVEYIREFRFDLWQENEIVTHNVGLKFHDTGVQVEYSKPLAVWKDVIQEIRPDDVLEEIGWHFLPYFLYRWLPQITIQFDDIEPENITAHFRKIFRQHKQGSFSLSIDGNPEQLHYTLARIAKKRQFKSHCLLLSAADRIVGHARDLTNKLGRPFFEDESGEKYVVIAVVRSDAFEKRLNDARTGINLPAATVEEIVTAVSDVIQSEEKDQIAKIRTTQVRELGDALKENPIFRLGLRGRSIQDYVEGKPNNWNAERFLSDLAIEKTRASAELTRQITAAANNPVDYEKRLKSIVEKLDEGKKEALAEYVIHRKNVIALIEAARRYQGSTTKRAPEDAIHELIFRRFSDNAKTEYFEHNLWLIDDLLSFVPYISSDRALHGKGRKLGDKVTDLLFFDDSMILSDKDGSTLSIVEFKKPSRDDYVIGRKGSDPVLQVLTTLEQATERGGLSTTDGAHINLNSVVRRFAFIVADITPSLQELLKFHDFKADYHPNIHVRYRANEEILIQAFGYDTLIENAKKRNQAFFSVLLGE